MLDLKNRSGQVAESGGRKRKAESELYSEKARNILARKRAKLAEVKNRYTDAVAEYTFIHFKGEVNDYANWKRRPMLPQVSFIWNHYHHKFSMSHFLSVFLS